MKKSTTNPSPAGATKRDRWLKIGVVGVALALAVSVTPLLGTQADAAKSETGACIQAESDSGKFLSLHGSCGDGDARPAPSEAPAAPFALICKSPDYRAIETTWPASSKQDQMYRVEVRSYGGEWKLAKSVPTTGYSADGRTLLALLGKNANGEDVGATYSGQLRVVYDTQGATRISTPIWFSMTTTVTAPSITC